MFWNKETEQTKTLTIQQTPPTNTAKISGYVYEDTNKNGVKDANEKFVSGWKLELKNIVPQETCNNTQNNNNDDDDEDDEEDRHYYDHEDEDECDEEHHHYKKRTVVTNNQWYYEFDSLPAWTYTLSQKMKKKWIIVTPTVWYYNITLTNWQQVTNKNFGNKNTKKK